MQPFFVVNAIKAMSNFRHMAATVCTQVLQKKSGKIPRRGNLFVEKECVYLIVAP
jgi:hypothetical protein